MLLFEDLTGICPVFGGYHKTEGTKNALVNLNNGAYLELIAIDNNNMQIQGPRWMGVDILTKNQITRWALQSKNLDAESNILKTYDPKMGSITGGSRLTADNSLLQWELIKPLSQPEVEIVPFFLDWSSSKIHPSDTIPKNDCEFIGLFATHPKPSAFSKLFKQLQVDLEIRKSEDIQLKMTIQTPKGIIEL